MNKVYHSAVVLCPPVEAWTPIQNIRKKYDRNFRRWMPHLTLLYPFYEKEQFDDVVDILTPACLKITPFEITFSRFQFFQHGRRGYTIWLVPEPEASVCTLQDALFQALPDCDDTRKHKNGFTPHLSVGQVKARDELDVLLAQLQNAWQPLSVRAEHIDLIWRNEKPDDVFRVGYTIGLGSGLIQRVNM